MVLDARGERLAAVAQEVYGKMWEYIDLRLEDSEEKITIAGMILTSLLVRFRGDAPSDVFLENIRLTLRDFDNRLEAMKKGQADEPDRDH